MSRSRKLVARCIFLGLLGVLVFAVIGYWRILPFQGRDQALIEACRLQNRFLIRFYLILGADMHATDRGGVTAFQRACERGVDRDFVSFLLNNGGTRDDLNGTLMLHVGMPAPVTKKMIHEHGLIFCPRSNAQYVTQLLLLGADPNARENKRDGLTALMFAAYSGNPETVRALVKAGADPNATAQGGDRALNAVFWHLYHCKDGKPESPNAIEVTTVLLENGALPYGCHASHDTPSGSNSPGFWISSKYCQTLNSKILQDAKQVIEQRSNVDKPDRFGWTLLMKAAALGNREIVDMLIRSGADVNARNTANETAKEISESFGQSEIVTLLLAHGAQ